MAKKNKNKMYLITGYLIPDYVIPGNEGIETSNNVDNKNYLVFAESKKKAQNSLAVFMKSTFTRSKFFIEKVVKVKKNGPSRVFGILSAADL